MIIDRKFAVLEETDGDFKGIDASLSLEDMDLIFSIVSENFYSDIEGSIVRELASNCVDSHTEAKVDDPIVIKYSDEEGTEYISFIDVGTGLNPERFEKIYMRYFKSTKRESNEFVGFFGIGSKSPLGYTDSFEVITRAEGIEYHYVVGKSESGKPRADLLNSKETTERNGTEVKIVINPGDYYKFKRAIEKQLIYFDNVFVDGFDVDNSFNIVESDTFKFRYSINTQNNPYEEMHISFGKVVYPINWITLNRPIIKLPIGVKFDIGELKVTNNREQIVYSDEAKELINKRIDLVLQKIKEIYNSQTTQELSLAEYLKVRNRPVRSIRLGLVDVPLPQIEVQKEGGLFWEKEKVDLVEGLNIGNYKEFKDTPIVMPDNPFIEYQIIDYLTTENINKRKRDTFSSPISNKDLENLFTNTEENNNVYYLLKEKTARNKKVDKYLYDKHIVKEGKRRIFLIAKSKKKISFKDFNNVLLLDGTKKEKDEVIKARKEYKRNIEDDNTREVSITSIPIINSDWNKTKLIQLYRKSMIKELKDVTIPYGEIEKSFEFHLHLKENKTVRNVVRREGVINAYDIFRSEETKLNLKSLETFKGIILYTYRGDSKRLRALHDCLLQNMRRQHINKDEYSLANHAIKGFMIGKTFFKHFQSNPYFMSVDEFLSNGNSVMQKMVTAHIVRKRLITIKSSTGELSNNLNDLSPEINIKEKSLVEFTHKFIRGLGIIERETPELLNEMVDVVVSNNWLIPHYIQDLEPVEEFYNDLNLFKYISGDAFKEKEGKEKVVEYLKMKKKKLDAIYYFVPTQEEQKILDYAEQLQNYNRELEEMKVPIWRRRSY